MMVGLYLLMSLPMYAALAVLNWKLSPAVLGWLNSNVSIAIYLLLGGLLILQVFKIISINKTIFSRPVPELHRYAFSQVAVLDLAYMVTFGTELALVSMLPLFYVNYFGASPVLAGILAGLFPVINLFARPAGGYFSDKFGRKLTMLIVFIGLTLSFILMGQVTKEWALPFVVATTILAGIFAKAGSGAVYSMVPLIQRRFTGQIAGMAGAYGNVGGVAFLTVLSFYDPHILFLTISATAGVVLLAVIFMLKEPKGQMAEVMEDGSVQMISVEK
jgi:NNP family nitrate/nitrite transporter-like MFS transporter